MEPETQQRIQVSFGGFLLRLYTAFGTGVCVSVSGATYSKLSNEYRSVFAGFFYGHIRLFGQVCMFLLVVRLIMELQTQQRIQVSSYGGIARVYQAFFADVFFFFVLRLIMKLGFQQRIQVSFCKGF